MFLGGSEVSSSVINTGFKHHEIEMQKLWRKSIGSRGAFPGVHCSDRLACFLWRRSSGADQGDRSAKQGDRAAKSDGEAGFHGAHPGRRPGHLLLTERLELEGGKPFGKRTQSALFSSQARLSICHGVSEPSLGSFAHRSHGSRKNRKI